MLHNLDLDPLVPSSINTRSVGFISSPASPGDSPFSTTSALLTPTEFSPAKSFDPKLSPAFDFGPVYQTQPNSLLFETGIPQRYLEMVNPDAVSVAPAQSDRFQHDSHTVPRFDPFSDRTTLATSQAFLPPLQIPSQTRGESAPTSPYSWGAQRFRTSSEWVRPEERRTADPAAAATERTTRSFQGSSPHGPTQSHEVRT